jgi:uncharacterized protein (TIGR03067 family)
MKQRQSLLAGRSVLRLATAVLFLAACALLVHQTGAQQQPKKKKGPLQGTWKAVSATEDGQEAQADKINRYLILQGRTFTMKEDDKVTLKGTFKVYPKQKPWQIDLTVSEGPEGAKGQTLKGIIFAKGDSMKWCSSPPGVDERPKEFAAPKGSGFFFVTLKRVTEGQ